MNVELKKISIMLFVIFFILVTFAIAWAEDKVLTIYFAGTLNTEDGAEIVDGIKKYDPELMSKLYQNDTSETLLSGIGPKYKFFVDGVGTHGCLASTADPMETCILPTCCRGFTECLEDAKGAFNSVGESEDLILNLVGYSRGGVLPMIMARWVADNDKTVKKINILAFDPVPGVTTNVVFGDPIGTMGTDLTLPEIVNQYVGIYARDERSLKFEPIIPNYENASVKDMLVSVRGSHETLVGNLEIDGHAATLLPVTPWMFIRDNRLENVFNISLGIAERLLSGSEWGEVTFDPSLFTADPKQDFLSYVDGMYAYPSFDYWMMHSVSFLPSLFGIYDLSYELLGRDHHLLIASPLPPLLHGRLAYRAPYRHAQEYIWWLFPFWWPNPDQVYLLDQYVKPINGEDAWERMEYLRGEPSSVDDEPPVPNDPDLPTIIGECSVTLTTEPTATDNIDGTIKGTTTDPLIYTEQGTYTVTWTYTDSSGNSYTQTQTLIVEDTTPPTVIISSPQDDGIYLNTQGPISVEYTAEDNCEDQLDIVMTLDSEEFTGDEIDLSSMPSGTHILVVKATDNSGNVGEDSITFTAEPQPLESFSIRHLKIHWASDSDNSWNRWWRRHIPEKHDRFSIFARLQLPEGYTVQDLEESATVTITMAGESANDTVVFKERTLRRRDVIWKYRGNEQPPGEGMNITKTTIWWPPQHGKWAGKAELYIRGVLELAEGIGKDTEPAEATVTVEVPVSTEAGSGSLLGEETVAFKVSKKSYLWFYRVWHKLPH